VLYETIQVDENPDPDPGHHQVVQDYWELNVINALKIYLSAPYDMSESCKPENRDDSVTTEFLCPDRIEFVLNFVDEDGNLSRPVYPSGAQQGDYDFLSSFETGDDFFLSGSLSRLDQEITNFNYTIDVTELERDWPEREVQAWIVVQYVAMINGQTVVLYSMDAQLSIIFPDNSGGSTGGGSNGGGSSSGKCEMGLVCEARYTS